MSENNENKQAVDLSQFRLMPTNLIDTMIQTVYNANKEQFDLYFNLIRVKEQNVLTAKTPVVEAPIEAKMEIVREESESAINDDHSSKAASEIESVSESEINDKP